MQTSARTTWARAEQRPLWQSLRMKKDPSSDLAKLRVKIGLHEFEAEGPHGVVAAHFKTWQQLIAPPPAAPPPATAPSASPAPMPAALDIFAADPARRLVTLRVYPTGKNQHADAAFLILYGYHECLPTDGQAVDVTRLKAALAASGYRNARIDRTLASHVSAGSVAKVGHRRGSTYQLTTAGYQRAAAMARALQATSPSGA